MKIDLSHLNTEQMQAVRVTEKPVLLLAGAGSGKTRVITYRIAHLIANMGVAPQKILALTFTNKAASEMKERVQAILKSASSRITVTTFHSLCVRILRKYIHLLGYQKDFVIFDTASQQATIKTIFEDEGIDPQTLNLKATFFEIMKIKGEGKGPEYFYNDRFNSFSQVKGKVFEEYNKTLKGCNAVDFEDILYLTLDLLNRFPDELQSLKEQYEYIMVDEYQDTNRVQYKIVKFLANKHKKLCVVGDDDQSIYGWRGADIRNILDYQKDFEDAEVIKLERNYRSTETILSAANDVISNNTGRMEKSLWTESNPGEKINWLVEASPREEISEVIHKMKTWQYKNGKDWADFAFLYRSNFQSRAIEEVLRDEGIPYQLIGGTKFFDRKEIQDCLAYMKFLHNPKDEISLLRVVNYPRRDLGKNTIIALTQERMKHQLSLFEMMERVDEMETLKTRAKNSVKSFVEMVYEFRQALEEEPFNVVFKRFFDRIEMQHEIERTEKNEQTREIRVNNYLEFLNSLFLYEDRRSAAGDSASLTDFLDYVSLFTDSDKHDEAAQKVSLFTVHSAKGLEFDFVAVVGMTDGQFPSHKSINSIDREAGIEEERRLFYVAITRARQKLVLSMPRRRMMYGEWQYNIPSRFIEEINPNLLITGEEFVDPEEAENDRLDARASFFEQFKLSSDFD